MIRKKITKVTVERFFRQMMAVLLLILAVTFFLESGFAIAGPVCPKDCSGHGVCAGGICSCSPGWKGVDCATKSFCPNNCSGHGTCVQSQCACGPGWSGDDCNIQINCANNCSGHGVCVNMQCCCENGWTGNDCSRKVLKK